MHFIPIFLVLGILWFVLDAYSKSTGNQISRVRRIDPTTCMESIEIHKTETTGGMKSVAGQAARFLKGCLVLMVLLILAFGGIVAVVIFVGR